MTTLSLGRWALMVIMGMAAVAGSACDASSAGGCDVRAVDGTCRDWFAPSAELEARRAEASSSCEGLGGTYQQTNFTCPTSGKVGACVLQSIANGPRRFYYDSAWTQSSARSDCSALGGSFIE